ncbi:MAG: hypothetical protein C3F11_00290 [Methylocystaceae bacterium]|nr:MAG: hypothetical protein C3F11_00290 [Methylocystaceae bacterium]
MGAALPGLPVINIGFTRNLAWTHTVDASSHFLIYRLKRDVADPSRYMVDGKSTAMQRKSVTVDVREKSGSITQRSRDFYRTEFGVVLDMSDRFGRDDEHAYVIDDVNLTNDAALEQWFAMNRANSVEGLESVVIRILGIPWVDTIAVGSNGAALFMNVSMIPRVDSEKLSRCRALDSDRPVSDIHVLDGTRRDCGRNVTSGLRQDGVFPGDRLPILRRDDFVINSNDTAWLANPSQPLTGFSPLVSRENVELGGRARYVLDWLRRRSDVGSPAGQRLGPDDVESLLMRDDVYSASLVMSDLLTLCPKNSETRAEDTETKDLASVCETLRAWDQTADVDANIGYLYFESFMERARKVTNVWRVPFDPSLPIDTPRGLNVGDPAVAEQLKAALAASHRDALKGGFRLDSRWGEIQVASRGGREIPIHGGSAALGVYNVIKSSPSGPGKREVASGSSYMQIVSFDGSGPQVNALLAFSESADPRSQFFADQTELFSRKEWVRLPFAEEEIKSDPSYRRQTIPY